MAKDRKKVQHIHSSVFDKQPTPESLELGELAVNANKDGSFISTKNNDNKVVRFSEDATIVDWMEYKEVLPYGAVTVVPTEQDLKNNQSQLLFKLNQVVANNTVHASDVNGKTDMHGNPINPISPDGTQDGAGFAVDMSLYIMQGSNPSFSSITTTCGAELNGTTKIKGMTGSCGSLLDINVGTVSTVADSANTNVQTATTNISSATTTIGTAATNVTSATTVITDHTYSGNSLIIKSDETTLSGSTFNGKVGVTNYSGGTITTTTTSNTSVNVGGNLTVNSTGDTILNATGDTCISSEKNANLYGKIGTTIGKNCSGTVGSATTINGTTIYVSGTTINENGTYINSTSTSGTNISSNAKVCIAAGTDASLYGKGNTIVGKDCDGTVGSATTINGTTINISGTTINESGATLNQNFTNITANTTNYDINGNVVCISGATNANFYGATTNVGIDCNNTTTATTINISGTTINVGGNEFSIDVLSDLCLNSRSATTLYGSTSTNVGISCDNTATAATTTVKGNKVIVDATVGNLGLTAKEDILQSAENDIIVTANNVLCETAGADATIYGVDNTNIGIDCSGNTPSTNTNINGGAISVDANTTLCMEGATKAALYGKETHIGINCNSGKTSTNVTINSSSAITLNAPVTNITGDTYISGDTVIGGTTNIINGLAAQVCSSYGSVRKDESTNWSTAMDGKCTNMSDTGTTTFKIPANVDDMTNYNPTRQVITFDHPVEIDGTVTAVAAIYSSDERLKENIQVVSRNDFNKAKRVQTKSFNFKDDPSKTKTYGVIAQEVEAAGLGELVYTRDDGFKAVDYTAFMMLKLSYLEDFCVNLAMKNEELKQRINELENKK